jgi:hypothetical protein
MELTAATTPGCMSSGGVNACSRPARRRAGRQDPPEVTLLAAELDDGALPAFSPPDDELLELFDELAEEELDEVPELAPDECWAVAAAWAEPGRV